MSKGIIQFLDSERVLNGFMGNYAARRCLHDRLMFSVVFGVTASVHERLPIIVLTACLSLLIKF